MVDRLKTLDPSPETATLCESMERELRFINASFSVFSDMSKGTDNWVMRRIDREAIESVIDDVHHMVARMSSEVRVERTVVNCDVFDWDFDVNRLAYILHALIENGVKAARNGKASEKKVESLLVREAGMMRLTVSDNGHGIKSELGDSIFNEGVSRFTPQSSGLGLSIVKSLVDSYPGSTIAYKSRVDVGTTFVVEFPT